MTERTGIKIETPAGYEIDIVNSDVADGYICFKEIKPKRPTKWSDFYLISGAYITSGSNINTIQDKRNDDIDKNTWPTKELAEASLALCQLVRYRDAWNEGWVPDWTDINTSKYVIHPFKGELHTDHYALVQSVLSFKSTGIRDEFLKTFKDLLEIAKPLL